MDQNSKENLLGQENQSGAGLPVESSDLPAVENKPSAMGEVEPPAVNATEPSPEIFSGETEMGNGSSVQPQTDDSQTQSRSYTEEEIHQQANELTPLPQEDKLDRLKSVALRQGLEKAVKIAKKMNDPRLLDELHDAIKDDPNLKTQLEAMGKLEKL
ncbi:MAG: hypothetical protein HY452_00995 [Parcubacteria group bacterium]|nr:hypothetical protein [Parcubacteria group bacterium]